MRVIIKVRTVLDFLRNHHTKRVSTADEKTLFPCSIVRPHFSRRRSSRTVVLRVSRSTSCNSMFCNTVRTIAITNHSCRSYDCDHKSFLPFIQFRSQIIHPTVHTTAITNNSYSLYDCDHKSYLPFIIYWDRVILLEPWQFLN